MLFRSCRKMNPISQNGEISKIEEEFAKVWPIILKDIKNDPKYNDIRSQIDWLEKVLEGTVPRENKTRAYLSMLLFRSLKLDRSPEDDFLNYVTGWMVQMTQAALHMQYDIMHDSETRNGQLCWHRNPEVELGGLNDAFMLESVAYNMVFKYFKGKDYLLKLVRMYRENGLCVGFGERLALECLIDSGSDNRTRPDLSKFTESRYQSIVKYRLGRFHFYGPMASAFIRAGIEDKTSLDAIKKLAIKFGEFLQLQNDFLNCFGDPTLAVAVEGMPGTGAATGTGADISDGKLTWLTVKALELGSNSQKKILHECYGQATISISAVNKVKNVYADLGLECLFHQEHEAIKQEIIKLIKELPETVPQEPCMKIFDDLCKIGK